MEMISLMAEFHNSDKLILESVAVSVPDFEITNLIKVSYKECFKSPTGLQSARPFSEFEIGAEYFTDKDLQVAREVFINRSMSLHPWKTSDNPNSIRMLLKPGKPS